MGDTYIIKQTGDKVAQAIENALQIDNKLSEQKTETDKEITRIEAIAKGRATGYVFDTEADMHEWLSVSENASKLVLGDNLYIRATGVPDYWWDGTSVQLLEVQKVDLAEYAKKKDVADVAEVANSKQDSLSGEDGVNSIQQPLDAESWTTSNKYVKEFIDNGQKTDDGDSIQSDGYVVKVGAFGDNSTMWNGKSQTVGGKTSTTGSKNIAFENNSNANGNETFAGGKHSHTRGNRTAALGNASSASGQDSVAKKDFSDAEGLETEADGIASKTIGRGTITKGNYTLARGKYNIIDDSATKIDDNGAQVNPYGKYVDIVGNGINDNSRSNAYTLDWKGNGWFAGDVSVGYDNQKLASEDFVLNNAMTIKKKTSEVIINDISPIAHDVRVEITPKNLISNTYAETSKTSYGVTFTVNSDGSIHAKGVATGIATFVIQQNFDVESGTEYVLSGFPTIGYSNPLGDAGLVWMYLRNANDNGNFLQYCSNSKYNVPRFVAQANSSTRIQITINKDVAIDTVFKPKISIIPTIKINDIDSSNLMVEDIYNGNYKTNIRSTYPNFKVNSQDSVEISVRYNQDVTSVLSNALKGTINGEAVALTDVSPIEHNLNVKVRSKNLLPYPYYATTKTADGITWTDNGDGTITANGTATARIAFSLVHNTKPFKIEKGKTYTISGLPDGCNASNGFRLVVQDTTYAQNIEGSKPIVAQYTDYYAFIRLEAGTVCDNLTFKPQLEEGNKATEYTPYVDINTVSVDKYGENLFDPSLVINRTQTGLTTTLQPDGGILLQGTATGTARMAVGTEFTNPILIPPGTYSVYGNYVAFVLKALDGTSSRWVNGTFTLTEFYKLTNMAFNKLTVGTEYNEIIYPSLTLGNTKKQVEYKEPINYIPNVDGTIEGITSMYPVLTILPDAAGVIIDCKYNRDINKAFAELEQKLTNAIISLGGNI